MIVLNYNILGNQIFYSNQEKKINVINKVQKDIEKNIKTSTTPLTPFVIDDSGGGDYTWAQAVSQPWCSGGGTSGNPYVIDDIYVDVGGSGSGILIRNSNVYFKIVNSTVVNGGGGMWDSAIRFENVNNGILHNNTILNNDGSGITLYTGSENNIVQNNKLSSNIFGIHISESSNNNRIYNNTIIDTINRGILVSESNNCVVDGNTVINSGNGIVVTMDSQNANITNNLLLHNPRMKTGLYIRGMNTYVSNNTMIGNGLELYGSTSELASISIDPLNNVNGKPVYYYKNENGLGMDNFTNAGQILLYNCNNSVISNLSFSNGHSGVTLWHSNNNKITKNNFSTNFYGIDIYASEYNNISENIITDNIGWHDMGSIGIYLASSDNNIIQRNVVKNNTAEMPFPFPFQQGGINLEICSNTSIDSNEIAYNSWGIASLGGSHNNIKKNNISYNIWDAIYLSGNNFTISSNKISNNQRNGINLRGYNHTIYNNTVYSNVENGFEILQSDNNTIFRNDIQSNSNKGISLDSDSESNLLYLNFFIANKINAIDNGSYNYWDNGTIGNYWDDYDGVDVNNDGIGDTPYLVPGTAGSQDNFPIYAPVITIMFPLPDNVFGLVAPNYQISIDDPDYNFTWYSLDGGSTNIYSNETMGTIDQSEWDKQSNGTVMISFYANNSLGNVGQAEVTVRKDILAPLITINSPSENQVCGVNAPTFDLTILEHEIDSTWYTLDYGSINVSFTGSTGTIDQTEWAKKGGGTFPIRFYANDSFGNVDFSEVNVVKDLTSPVISINSPDPYELFGKAPPNFDITITESNPDLMWYTLDSGATNVTFGSLTGTIDQTEWNKQGNGTVIIVFYAKDKGGNEGYAEVIVRKDISDPIVTINTPIENDLFGFTAPSFSVTVIEPDFESMWYTLDDGVINITTAGFTGDISQTEWNKKGSGMITIRFYANDTWGNKGYAEITVEKDVTDPIIQVNVPVEDEVFGYDAPSYDVSITDSNLDSMWYTLDNGATNILVFSSTGFIDQSVWDSKGSGIVPIRFYANDTMGNTDYTEVIVIKDLIDPIVNIISPNENEVFGADAPDFEISLIELNLDTMWYTLDGGLTNITLSSLTGTISQTEWDKKSTEDVTIRFYARDESGNEDYADVTVSKDTSIPIITINSPLIDEFFGFRPPQYNITVVEPNIDMMWYTLDYGATLIPFTEFTGTIDQIEWDKFGDGTVVIRFYVRDKGDNEAFVEVSMNKDLVTPLITINEPEFGEVFVDIAPLYSITIVETSLDSYWYSLDDGQTNYTIPELTGAISQSAWNSLSDGHITLRFYAKDEAGNVGQSSVIITKRTSSEPIPPGIPGYDLYLLLGALSVISALLIRKRLKS